MEYLRTDTVSVGTLYRKDAKLSRGAGAYFCKHFVPAGAQGGGRLPTLPLRCSQGGLPSLPPACPAFPEAAGGAWRFWSPAYPAFSLLSFPHPPARARRALFPAGRGRLKVYFAGGFAPGTPALDRLRHLQPLPCGHPGAEPMVRRKNDRKRFSMSSAGSQGEGGPGERNFGV